MAVWCVAVVNAISYMRPTQLQRVLISPLIRPCLPKGGRIYMRESPLLPGVYIYRRALLFPPPVLSNGRKAATHYTVSRPRLWISMSGMLLSRYAIRRRVSPQMLRLFVPREKRENWSSLLQWWSRNLVQGGTTLNTKKKKEKKLKALKTSFVTIFNTSWQ